MNDVQRYTAAKNYIGLEEKRILELLARGHGFKEIPNMLHMSYSTMKFHLRVARGILGVKTTIQAVAVATAMRIITPFSED